MYLVDTDTGLLNCADYLPSPNCDDRPEGVPPELLIVHSISLPPGQYERAWIDDFFQNKLDCSAHEYFAEIEHLRVSAHLLIGRSGHVRQYVPFHRRAWHAGVSQFGGRSACNDFSIGIELEGTDNTPFRTVQYWKLAQIVSALRNSYPSLVDCPIVGHSDVAPGRKTDPGTEFDWSRFKRLLDVQSRMFSYG